MLLGVLRSRRAYLALILSYILILLLSASFATVGYRYLYERQREQSAQQLQSRLEQAVSIAESRLESVRQAMLSTAMGMHSSSFIYKAYPFSVDDYYDQAQTIKELRSINAVSECAILGMYVSGIDSVITPATRLSARDFYSLELSADSFTLDDFRGMLSDPGYFEAHRVISLKSRPGHLMLFSLALPLGIGGRGTVISGIGIDEVLSGFVSGGFMNDYSISIENSSGQIYTTGQLSEKDAFSISAGGKSGLTYSASAPKSMLEQQLAPTRRLIAQLVILELLGGIVFALLLAKANYSPIKMLLARFTGAPSSSGSGMNEYERISDAASRLIDSNSELKAQLLHQTPLLRASILRRYFMGIGSVGKEELESYGIRYDKECLALLIIDTGTAAFNYSLIALVETLGCEAFETGENCVCVIVNEGSDKIDEKLRQVYMKIQSLLASSPVAGRSSGILKDHCSPTELYSHAKQAYEYAKAWQLIGMIDYDSLSITPAAYILNSAQEQRLTELLTNGEPEPVRKMISTLISSARHEPLIHLRIMAYGIITVYHRFIANWKSATLLKDEMDSVSARIAETNDPAELKELLETLAVKITSEAERIGEDIQNNLSNRVEKLINERFSDSSLSLTDVANALEMNASYISHIFKQQTGTGFTEALTLVRLEHSRTLLQSSSLTLNAVSEKCGFTSAAYFSRVFKKQYGITPGQFRGYQD